MRVKEIRNISDINSIIENDTENLFNLILDFKKNGKFDQNKAALLNYITDNFDKLENKVSCLNFFVPYERIPKKEFSCFLKFYQKIENKIPCYVDVNHEYHNGIQVLNAKKENISQPNTYSDAHWDIKTIIKANTEINKVCDFVKGQSFSPFETLAYIHNYVSTVANYNTSTPVYFHDARHDQFFAGAYDDIPEIVCAGYSSLMFEIIESLNLPNLKCQLVRLDVKNLEKNFISSHQKCLIKIKDDKYGLNQTVFDDPTFDNKEGAISSKYSHFAMPNDCHIESKNKLWQYNNIFICRSNENKNVVQIQNFDKSKELYNNSKNQIDQKMIETVYANIMHKCDKNASSIDIYKALKVLAKESFRHQINKKYIGNLTKSDLILTKKEIDQICDRKNEKTFVF